MVVCACNSSTRGGVSRRIRSSRPSLATLSCRSRLFKSLSQKKKKQAKKEGKWKGKPKLLLECQLLKPHDSPLFAGCSDIGAVLLPPQSQPLVFKRGSRSTQPDIYLWDLEFQRFDSINSRTEQNELKMHTHNEKLVLLLQPWASFSQLGNSRILCALWAWKESREREMKGPRRTCRRQRVQRETPNSATDLSLWVFADSEIPSTKSLSTRNSARWQGFWVLLLSVKELFVCLILFSSSKDVSAYSWLFWTLKFTKISLSLCRPACLCLPSAGQVPNSARLQSMLICWWLKFSEFKPKQVCQHS